MCCKQACYRLLQCCYSVLPFIMMVGHFVTALLQFYCSIFVIVSQSVSITSLQCCYIIVSVDIVSTLLPYNYSYYSVTALLQCVVTVAVLWYYYSVIKVLLQYYQCGVTHTALLQCVITVLSIVTVCCYSTVTVIYSVLFQCCYSLTALLQCVVRVLISMAMLCQCYTVTLCCYSTVPTLLQCYYSAVTVCYSTAAAVQRALCGRWWPTRQTPTGLFLQLLWASLWFLFLRMPPDNHLLSELI